MELALELVNHVPPDIADGLIERLRRTEAARSEAEERCLRAEARCAAAAARARASTGSALHSCGSLLFAAALAFALTLALARGLAPLASASVAAAAAHAAGAETAVPRVPAKVLSVHAGDDPHAVCQDLLREVRGETETLRRRHSELREGYNRALEEVGSWLDFLRRAWSPQGLGDESRTSHTLKSSELEAHCLEAARPGRWAIEELLKRAGGKHGTSRNQVEGSGDAV